MPSSARKGKHVAVNPRRELELLIKLIIAGAKDSATAQYKKLFTSFRSNFYPDTLKRGHTDWREAVFQGYMQDSEAFYVEQLLYYTHLDDIAPKNSRIADLRYEICRYWHLTADEIHQHFVDLDNLPLWEALRDLSARVDFSTAICTIEQIAAEREHPADPVQRYGVIKAGIELGIDFNSPLEKPPARARIRRTPQPFDLDSDALCRIRFWLHGPPPKTSSSGAEITGRGPTNPAATPRPSSPNTPQHPLPSHSTTTRPVSAPGRTEKRRSGSSGKTLPPSKRLCNGVTTVGCGVSQPSDAVVAAFLNLEDDTYIDCLRVDGKVTFELADAAVRSIACLYHSQACFGCALTVGSAHNLQLPDHDDNGKEYKCYLFLINHKPTDCWITAFVDVPQEFVRVYSPNPYISRETMRAVFLRATPLQKPWRDWRMETLASCQLIAPAKAGIAAIASLFPFGRDHTSEKDIDLWQQVIANFLTIAGNKPQLPLTANIDRMQLQSKHFSSLANPATLTDVSMIGVLSAINPDLANIHRILKDAIGRYSLHKDQKPVYRRILDAFDAIGEMVRESAKQLKSDLIQLNRVIEGRRTSREVFESFKVDINRAIIKSIGDQIAALQDEAEKIMVKLALIHNFETIKAEIEAVLNVPRKGGSGCPDAGDIHALRTAALQSAMFIEEDLQRSLEIMDACLQRKRDK